MKASRKLNLRTRSSVEKDLEGALFRQMQQTVEPPPVLDALVRFLLKKSTLAKCLGVSSTAVQLMFQGKMKVPVRLLPRLYDILRHTVGGFREQVRRAESGEILYNGLPFPQSAIEYHRERIRIAEKLLAEYEKGQ